MGTTALEVSQAVMATNLNLYTLVIGVKRFRFRVRVRADQAKKLLCPRLNNYNFRLLS